MTFTNDFPCGRSQIFTALEEMALANSHLLPETKKVVYFVTAMQGESKKNYLHRVYVEFKEKIQRPQEKNGI
jgi:hypothetical protein